jgi:monoterpene epsilon-lactone hydrolase
VRLTREFLPVLAAEPAAQLVNVSSIFGLIAPPRQTAYCASKFALRGFSESLRHELEMAGSTTGVTLVHPGGVRTAIAERARLPDAADEQERERYRSTWKALLALSPDEAAARIVRAIERREARVLIGRDAAQAAWLQRLAPVRYWSWVRRGLERRVRARRMMRPAVSWQARLAAWVLRHRVKPRLGDFRDLDRIRAVFGTRMPSPRGVRYRSDSLGAVPGEWVEAASVQAPRATLLYLHGGGFVGCSPRTHRPLTAALARRGFRVYVPAYRLAPEHPFPAAPDDVQRVWQALRAAVPGRLVVAGESAGGNLALGLALALRDGGQALPDALALFSPALDLSGGSASFTLNAERDAMFRGDCLANLRDFYLAGADPAELRASPPARAAAGPAAHAGARG